MRFVLDASVATAWQLADEAIAGLDHVLGRTLADGALVPALWRLEVANALLVAERRQRVAPGFTRDALADLALLPIDIDSETDIHAWGRTAELAQLFGLTTYDAAYLELAERAGSALATLDRALASAARARGIELLLDGS